jgi:hypothetical protein
MAPSGPLPSFIGEVRPEGFLSGREKVGPKIFSLTVGGFLASVFSLYAGDPMKAFPPPEHEIKGVAKG